MLRKYYLTLVWGIVIMVLCLMPQSSVPKSHWFDIIPFFDKLVHFILYVIFSFLMGNENQAYQKQRSVFFNLFLICFVYGFVIEIMQATFTIDRHFEIADGLSDGLGTLAGLLLSYRIHARYLHR